MALQFKGGPFAGSYTTNTFNTGKAQPMPPPSQGTPYGGKGFQGNVFQGNLGRQPQPPSQPAGRVMDGPGSFYGPGGPRMADETGFKFPGGPQQPGRVMDGPGSFYGPGGPRMADETGFNYQNPRQPPQWNMGDDIRRPPNNPAPPPMPPAQQPGRVMDGPGSGYGPRGGYGFGDDFRVLPGPGGGFPPPPTQPPPVAFRPGQANPIQPQVEESPEDYRRSIAAERARAARMDSEAAAKRQKMQQNRPTYNVPGYANPVTDPMVAQNEYDRIAREQRAAARGEKPRKTQMELDMEARNASHRQHVQQRAEIQEALPGQDQATRKAIQQRVSAYGETPEEAFRNGGFAAQQAYASSRMNDGPGPSARTPAGQSRWR